MTDQIKVSYDLRRLPTVQHRAGLGGLLFLLRYLSDIEGARPPVFRVLKSRLELDLDKDSLALLLEHLYADEEVLRLTSAKPKGDDFREVQFTQNDGKVVKKYEYKDRRPKGDWMSRCGYGAEWLGLWQDSIWSTLRDKPASREIYTGSKAKLSNEFWKALVNTDKGKPTTLELASALYIGGRSKSNEEVSFDGTPENVFLLHFAHAIAQPFKVVALDSQGDRTYPGLVWVYLEPGNLVHFAKDIRTYLGSRRESSEEGVAQTSFYPSTRVTMPQEAGLAVLDMALAHVTTDAIAGAFCAQLDKQGNNVNLLGVAHIPADYRLLTQYREIVAPIGNYALKRMVLTNLLKGAPLYRGTAKLMSYLPAGITLAGSKEGRGFSLNSQHLLKSLQNEKGSTR